MRIPKVLMALALLGASFQEELSDDEHERRFAEKYESCKNFDYRSLQEIARDIDERRADRDNHFFAQYRKAVDWLRTKNNNRIIEASRGPTAVTIIFIIFTAVLAIVLILACLDVIKRDGSKTCLYLAIVLWIIYSCFFWAAFTLEIQAN